MKIIEYLNSKRTRFTPCGSVDEHNVVKILGYALPVMADKVWLMEPVPGAEWIAWTPAGIFQVRKVHDHFSVFELTGFDWHIGDFAIEGDTTYIMSKKVVLMPESKAEGFDHAMSEPCVFCGDGHKQCNGEHIGFCPKDLNKAG